MLVYIIGLFNFTNVSSVKSKAQRYMEGPVHSVPIGNSSMEDSSVRSRSGTVVFLC